MAKKPTDEQIEARIRKAFTDITGLEAVEVSHAFPASCGITVHTETRTFYGWLTFSAFVKAGSWQEDTGKGLVPLTK